MNIFRKMVHGIRRVLVGKELTSEDYVNRIRRAGGSVGERTYIFDPKSVVIDMSRPELIEIGNDVQIAHGVVMLTHGYDWSVLKGVYGEILGSSGKVTIGNNVFIGMNTTILKGVTVGNNVIIGACSLVNRDIPDNSVAVGNPARVVSTLEAYYEKRKAAQYEEAAELVRTYRQQHGQDPDDAALNEFFWLFCKDPQKLCEPWDAQMHLVGNYEQSLEAFKNHTPMFESKEAFLASVK